MGATAPISTLRNAEPINQLIQAPQLSAVYSQLLEYSLPSPAQTFKQGATLIGRCLQVRDCCFDLCQSESDFARCGDEFEFSQRLLAIFAITVWQAARRRDEADALVKPQCVSR